MDVMSSAILNALEKGNLTEDAGPRHRRSGPSPRAVGISEERSGGTSQLVALLSGLRGDDGLSRLSEARSGPVDDHAATELKLYIDNDYKIYKWKASIDLGLAKWAARGQYNSKRAKEAYDRLVMDAAKQYISAHASGPVQALFNKQTRDMVASSLRDDFEDEIKSDPMAYDKKLPKKWQGNKLVAEDLTDLWQNDKSPRW